MLPERLTALRKGKGYSQAQLAQVLNLSPSAIGMYEQGRRVPDLGTLISLADLYRISLDYLITGKEYRYPGSDN